MSDLHASGKRTAGKTLLALLSLSAALLVLAMIVLSSPARAGAPRLPLLGEWTLVPPVTTSTLRDISMVSSNLGWAVGEGGTLLQYDGTQWHQVNISTTDDLIDIFMLSPTNGYIIGWNPNGSDIFHFNGTDWPLEYTTSSLSRLHASSANNVWGVGLNISVHWDGTRWSVVPIPVERQVFAVWATSDTEAWAVGQYEPMSNSGLIMHYTNGQWVQVASPSPQSLFDCFFTAPDDGWTVGYDVDIYHYDGIQWSFAYTNTYSLSRLFMLSHTEGWGISEVSRDIAYFDGSGWSQVYNPEPIGTYPDAIDMVSRNEGWIVGGGGLMLHYVDSSTPTPTATPAATETPVPTSTATAIPTWTSTATATSTPTRNPSATPTECVVSFSDVHPEDYFYRPVIYLACHGAVSGYSDGTFRPYNNTTRGQLSKIVVLAEGWPIDVSGGPHFSDVPPGNPFYSYIETAYHHGVISGYAGGTFKWGNNITRAQLSKIIVVAEGWTIDTHGGPHFSDVPESDTFYGYIETAFNKAIISGYADGTFKPGNNATRGQIAKIVYNAITAR